MYKEIKEELQQNKKNLIEQMMINYYNVVTMHDKVQIPYAISNVKRYTDKILSNTKSVNNAFNMLKRHLQTSEV